MLGDLPGAHTHFAEASNIDLTPIRHHLTPIRHHLTSIQQAVRQLPIDYDAQCSLATVLLEEKRTAEAAVQYRVVLRAIPSHEGAKKGLAHVIEADPLQVHVSHITTQCLCEVTEVCG